LIKEYKAIAASHDVKAYVHFCFEDEDSFENDINYCISAELAVLKSSIYLFCGSDRQWDSNWERMLHDGMYMTDDEFLSNFNMDRSCVMQLNRLVEDDQVFRSISGKIGR